ncbi:MAG: cysteine--tRNA ligase [Oligoflexia bacterium]|nr:cysteine--tRNA ligase [Oligoflexia bacterium]
MTQGKPTSIRPIRLTNTLSGKKELLETREPGRLTMYSCGPTVYGLIHIGNLRAALVSDMVFRYFKRVGYDVTYVRNYTDVDDKIIKRANEEKIPSEEVARKYIQEVEKDYAVSGMLEPTYKTTVTDHIPEIIALIERILSNGKGYAVDGEVFFSIESFPGYGKLSHKPIEDLVAGMRVDVREKKRNPLDFSLWKPAKPGEPSWDSPWGKGRPGWHIECSAMSSKWLGDQIDVHHGGEDLVFPHHENEIAQSEAASGKAPFVRYWLHHAFINMAKEKMSKSLGNIITAREFLTKYSGELARFLFLSIHYRSPIEFGDEALEQALVSLHRLYEAKARAWELAKTGRARADLRAEGAWGSFLASCEKTRQEIDECYANDFNTAGALGAVFSLIREFNRVLQEPLAAATPAAALGAQQLISVIEEELGSVMGVGRLEPSKALADIERVRAEKLAAATGGTRISEAEILAGIQARADARKAKDFARADEIRKELEARGVLIKDGPAGTTWQFK